MYSAMEAVAWSRVVNPVDALGEPLNADVFHRSWAHALDSDRSLKRAGRIRLLKRAEGEGLPLS
jgi:hypothetical protein